MKQRTIARYVSPVLILVLFLSSVALSFAQEKKTLRIVFVSLSWNNQLPFRIAITKGFFKDQGLTVEPIFVRGGPTALAALISGDVDFASVGGAQAPIRSRAKGLDIHIIASQSNYTNYTLLGSKEAKTVEELRGKIIGVTGAGAFSDFAIRIYLKRNNLIIMKAMQTVTAVLRRTDRGGETLWKTLHWMFTSITPGHESRTEKASNCMRVGWSIVVGTSRTSCSDGLPARP